MDLRNSAADQSQRMLTPQARVSADGEFTWDFARHRVAFSYGAAAGDFAGDGVLDSGYGDGALDLFGGCSAGAGGGVCAVYAEVLSFA